MVKNVCLMLAVLLMVHLNCEAAAAEQGMCESCLNGAAADLGLFDLADVLLKFEEVASK